MTVTPARRGGRRVIAFVLTGLVALALAPSALATDHNPDPDADVTHFRGESADADWSLHDGRDTEVTAHAFNGEFYQPRDEPEHRERLYLGVSQSYCDEDTDELVDRWWWGYGPAATDIDTMLLAEADAYAELALHGHEIRVPDCDHPDYRRAESTDLGPAEVTFDGRWHEDGPMRTDVSGHQHIGPGYAFHSQQVSRTRDAKAQATLTGLGNFGVAHELGTTPDAEIFSSEDSTISLRY